MLWTMLSVGIILIWVIGMILAARLGEKSSEPSRESDRLGNCRRGAIRLDWKINPIRGATLLPKGPR
jgi:hypothetical protein